MYKAIKDEGYDSAVAFRKDRKGEPFFRSLFAKIFYNLMNKISNSNMINGARDFRLMSRKMVNAVISLEESVRFTKRIFSWVGFKTKWIQFENKERIKGKTKLPMNNAFSYAFRGIVAFSIFPLLLTSIIGLILCVISIIYVAFILIKQLLFKEAVAGYTSLMCAILFCFGLMFLVLGIIGQYLAQMYLEKKRPKYIIRESDMKNRMKS